jgi:hypothetical protein
MSAAQEQHKGRCTILQVASITLPTILLGVVVGTIYNKKTLESFKDLGLDSLRAKNLLPSFISNHHYATKPAHTTDEPFPLAT